MSNLLNRAGSKVINKVAKGYIKNNVPQPTDPVYEFYEDTNGRQKKRKRPMPPGLSDRDVKILRSVRKRARRLDQGMNFCGLRFGWTFIIGLIPGAGDAADALLGYVLVIRKAKQAEIPTSLIFAMLKNTALATAVGTIPFAGDVFIAAYKANSRNAMLLERFLTQRGADVLKEAAARQAEEDAKARVRARAAAEEVAGGEARMSTGNDAAAAAAAAAPVAEEKRKPERWPTSLFARKKSGTKKKDSEDKNANPKGRFIEHVEQDRDQPQPT